MSYPSSASAGFTLLELLITLVIASLIATLALPAGHQMMEKWRAHGAAQTLIAQIQLVRIEAVSRNRFITLCPLDSTSKCSSDWTQTLSMFEDANQNSRKDDNEEVLRELPQQFKSATLQWKSFGNRNFIRFSPTGITPAVNGSLHYCPTSKNREASFRIVVARVGRARTEWKTALCT